MFRKTTKTFFLLLALPYVAGAQTVFRSLEDIWKYADDHNVTIRTAQYEADKSVYSKKQSYSALLPQVSATASATDNTSLQTTLIPGEIVGRPPGSVYPVQFGQKYIYTAGFSAQMDILYLQSWYNTAVAKCTEEYNRASLANTRKAIYQQIATQYYGYLLMQEAARLARQSQTIADSVLQTVNNKFKEGSISEANVDVAKINLSRAQQTSITAQFQMQTACNNIKGLLGLTVSDSLKIDAVLENNMGAPTDAPFREDPSVRLAYSQSRISLAQYKAGNSTYVPTLTLLYNNTTQQNDNKFEPFQTGPAWYPARYWTLRASWTIFNGGSRWYQSKKNKLDYNEHVMQFEHSKNQAAINDENIKLSYQKAAALLVKTEDVMKLSFDNYTHISYRYEAGIEPLENRLNAFTDYITYQNQYLNSLSDMLVQLYQVKIRQQSF